MSELAFRSAPPDTQMCRSEQTETQFGSNPCPPLAGVNIIPLLTDPVSLRGEVIPEQLAVSEPPRHNKMYIAKKIIYFCFL